MTLGDLSEEDLEGIRTGAVGDPTVGQVVALAGVFGVEPSYMLDRGEPVFDAELVEALRDETVRETIRETLDPGDENIGFVRDLLIDEATWKVRFVHATQVGLLSPGLDCYSRDRQTYMGRFLTC